MPLWSNWTGHAPSKRDGARSNRAGGTRDAGTGLGTTYGPLEEAVRLARFSPWSMRVRIPRGPRRYSTWPHRSWVRIRGFHPREQSSSLCGATKAAVRQDRYEDGKARHSRSGVVQSVGRCPVKAAIWVRIPVPEPWWRSSAGQSAGPSSQRSRVRSSSSPLQYHAPVVKRRSCRITDPAVGVRVPPGALHARLAQWESARFTPARRIGSIPSPSTVAVAQPGRAPGCDPGGCAFEPRRSPHARVA